MALTINDFAGAETGGIEEFSAVAGSLAVNSTAASGQYSWDLTSNAGAKAGSFSPFQSVADAGGKYILHFKIHRYSNPLSDTTWLECSEGVTPFLSITRDYPTNDILIVDANGATIRTITGNIIPLDTWVNAALVFEHSASGSVELFIDDVSQGEDTAQDLTNGGTFDTIKFGAPNGTAPYYLDDYCFLSGATAASDRFVDWEVFAYQGSGVTTSDWTKGGLASSLNSGAWDGCTEIPFSDSLNGVYNDTTARAGGVDTENEGGSEGTGGPNTDANIDGDSNIVAMKGIWRMKRSGGSGATHFGLMGNTGTAIADSDRTADFNPTTAYANYFDVREDNLPLSTEYGRIGFEKDNKGQDFDCADMLFQILHVPTPPPPPIVAIPNNRKGAVYAPFLVR